MKEVDAVAIETNGPVTTVILNRPHVRNAVDRPTAEALAAAFLAFEADESQSVAVLWGAGGTFCAGADLKAVADGHGNRTVPVKIGAEFDPLAADGPMGPTRLCLSKPVIAAVSGHAVAGGLELACWCDLRVAEESAVFGVFCRRWGVPLIDGGTVRLPRIVGHGRAMDLILTGRRVEAAECLSMGLASRVCAEGAALGTALELAREIARFPQACLRADRASALRQWSLDMARALASEWTSSRAFESEGVEGARRFASGKGRGGDFGEI